jgi:hypothetical protein
MRFYARTVSATRASWSPVTDSTCADHKAQYSGSPNTSRNLALAGTPAAAAKVDQHQQRLPAQVRLRRHEPTLLR